MVFLLTFISMSIIETVTSIFIHSINTDSMNDMQKETYRLIESDKRLQAAQNKSKMIGEFQKSLSGLISKGIVFSEKS